MYKAIQPLDIDYPTAVKKKTTCNMMFNRFSNKFLHPRHTATGVNAFHVQFKHPE